jgi:hypothetical protein
MKNRFALTDATLSSNVIWSLKISIRGLKLRKYCSTYGYLENTEVQKYGIVGYEMT